ncbi:hypothetical protein [Massilia pseudoviolaceinigra]|uniref:hypothetical protein n=1 Tax=Massilia pseudoviolaceinigra TaxID=3057165 RepID=UPI0027969DC5|nr:hypothetical protein [Massilia sp. CCM 9206]MDQ1921677.1 hypothetical protein [Massilia sp. CCM 9206]
MHGQVKATTQEVLDHYLAEFVKAVGEVRNATDADQKKKARNKKAEIEVQLVKAYNRHADSVLKRER